jgi:prepilin-type N-terminal cleavage/methylation domain-containing protein
MVTFRRNGFTLIELSIVLIVIAIIAGGVMAGRNIIRASKVASVVSDYNKYKTVILLFFEKYSALPGDMSNATSYWSTTYNGNGDGDILPYEFYPGWQQLALAGLIGGKFTGTLGSPPRVCVDVNFPGTKIFKNAGYHIMNYYPDTGYYTKFSGGLYISIGRENCISDAYYPHGLNGGLYPPDAKSVDDKMDDGLPYSGQVMQPYNYACPTGTTNAYTPASYTNYRYCPTFYQIR